MDEGKFVADFISANLDNLQAIADWKTSTSGTKVDFMKEMQAKGIPLTHLSMQALARRGRVGKKQSFSEAGSE